MKSVTISIAGMLLALGQPCARATMGGEIQFTGAIVASPEQASKTTKVQSIASLEISEQGQVLRYFSAYAGGTASLMTITYN
jgi:type 1 fimbria pilin